MIIKIFRSKKLPKILEIREIREKTTSFTIFSFFFFFKFVRLFRIENKYIYISEKINQSLFKFLEAKISQKSLKFDKFAKKRRVLQFFAFFFKFTRLLSIKNKYVYILEKINQWLFKVLEAKNDQFSLKFSKFAKKRQVLQYHPALIFSIFWKLKNITFNSAMQLKIPNINRVFSRSSKPAEHFCDF